ncbi:MAG: 3'-5' exonuclease, partial [Nanoarchaeota archaeon]
MNIQFYPYDFRYKVEQDNVYVYLYGKTVEGTKLCVRIVHRPYFYARLKGVDIPAFEKRLEGLHVEQKGMQAKVMGWELVERELLGVTESFWKIYVNYPKAVPLLAKQLQDWGVECYEKDIVFVHRFLRDAGIIPMTKVEAVGEYVAGQSVWRVPCFEAHSLTSVSSELLQAWKILAFDIETYAESKQINPHKNPILMVSFHGKDEMGKEFRKVVTWKKFSSAPEYVEFVESEAELLQRFRDIVVDYNPDIITGYFTDGFDFPYIQIRAEKLGVKLDLGVEGSSLITSSSFREGEALIEGIVHVDMLKFIKQIFGMNLKTDSYTLDAVSSELLGHSKQVVNLDRLAYVWDHEPEQLAEYCAYNLH